MSTLLCAVVKTIGVIVSVFVSLALFTCCMYWVVQNFNPSFLDIMKIFSCVMLLYCLAFCVSLIFCHIYNSCKESNQKKTTTNVN